MIDENYLLKSPTHAANLNDMRLTGKMCDVTIKVEQRELHAHKVVLAASLKYFESMFLSSFQESKQDVITMKDVDESNLEIFITYAYTGEMLITKNNALGLLEVANYLNEDIIKEACINYLDKHLDTKDAFGAYKFANAVECLTLKNAAKSRILSNFRDCSRTVEYLDLDFESLKDILNGVKYDNDESQQLLFEGIMGWIMHSAKDRRVHTKDALCFIDVAKLKTDYLIDYLGSMADRYDDDFGAIKDIMSHRHTCIKRQRTKQQDKNSAEILIILDGFAIDDRVFQFYNFLEKKWSSFARIPDTRGSVYFGSGILNDRLYYIVHEAGIFKLEVFNPATKRCKTLHSSSSILKGAAICACTKFLYLCGGAVKDTMVSDQVLRYDPKIDSFETLPPMGIKRDAAAAVYYQDYLYVLGGGDEHSDIDSVERYDPDAKKWKALPSMRVPRHYPGVCALDGKLYACGGDENMTVEVYDIATNRWQLVASMKERRMGFPVIADEDKLLAFGGDTRNTVEVYDPSKDEWQIDNETSSGLRLRSPVGGLIS